MIKFKNPITGRMISIKGSTSKKIFKCIKPIRIGTDCSGIESPIQAFEQLGIPYKHKWSSDIDTYVIKSIKANYNPEIIYGDPF